MERQETLQTDSFGYGVGHSNWASSLEPLSWGIHSEKLVHHGEGYYHPGNRHESSPRKVGYTPAEWIHSGVTPWMSPSSSPGVFGTNHHPWAAPRENQDTSILDRIIHTGISNKTFQKKPRKYAGKWWYSSIIKNLEVRTVPMFLWRYHRGIKILVDIVDPPSRSRNPS